MELIWQLAIGLLSLPPAFFVTRGILLFGVEKDKHLQIEYVGPTPEELKLEDKTVEILKKQISDQMEDNKFLSDQLKTAIRYADGEMQHIKVKGMRWGESRKPAKERTVEDVFNDMDEEQKSVVYHMVGEALDSANPHNLRPADSQMTPPPNNVPQNPLLFNQIKSKFESLTFEQKRIACYLFSVSFESEIVEIFPSGSYTIYDNMGYDGQKWIANRQCDINEYMAGKATDTRIGEYLARQVDIMHDAVLEMNAEVEEEVKTFGDDVRYITKSHSIPPYEAGDL